MSRFTSPFAFLGRSTAASDDDTKDDKNKSKSKAENGDDDEDDDKKKDKKNEDAKSKKGAKAEDGDDGDDDKKKKKDGEDDDEDDKAKSKNAKSKASDDEDDDESDTSAKKARARERDRVRAILTSPAGQADPVAAAHVALDTGMPRADAIAMLTAMQLSRDAIGAGPGASGRPNRAGLPERMEGVPNAEVGADAGQGKGPSMADRILAAGKKARGEA